MTSLSLCRMLPMMRSSCSSFLTIQLDPDHLAFFHVIGSINLVGRYSLRLRGDFPLLVRHISFLSCAYHDFSSLQC